MVHMEGEGGIRVHIDSVEVLVHPKQGTHARADLHRVA
jgi:hypothetical protein